MAKSKRVTVEGGKRLHFLRLDGVLLVSVSDTAVAEAQRQADTLNAAFDKTAADGRAEERKKCVNMLQSRLDCWNEHTGPLDTGVLWSRVECKFILELLRDAEVPNAG